jgi:hypothetical protein
VLGAPTLVSLAVRLDKFDVVSIKR